MNTNEQWSEFKKQIENFRLPRCSELPDMRLYSYQVINLLVKHLSIFEEESKRNSFITASMINNYVKDGVIPKPVKKKYSRWHVCYLIVICLLKKCFSINEIKAFFVLKPSAKYTDRVLRYDYFCDQIESALQSVFNGYKPVEPTEVNVVSDSLVALAFAAKVYAEKSIQLKFDKYMQTCQSGFTQSGLNSLRPIEVNELLGEQSEEE